MMNDQKNIKIGIFGAAYCGKKSITMRYIKGEYCEGYIPTIEDVFEKTIQLDNENIHISLIDTGGQDDFAEMRNAYYLQSQGFVLVFDVQNEASIDDLKAIYNDIISCVEDKNNICCVLAANKSDLRDENRSDIIPIDEYKRLEEYFKCKVFEVSSKTGMNVDNMFEYLIHQIISKQTNKNPAKKASPAQQKADKKKPSFWSKHSAKKKPNEEGRAKEDKSNEKKSIECVNHEEKASEQVIEDMKNQLEICRKNEEVHRQSINKLAILLDAKTSEAEASKQRINELEKELENERKQRMELESLFGQRIRDLEKQKEELSALQEKNKELEKMLSERRIENEEGRGKRYEASIDKLNSFRRERQMHIYSVDEIDSLEIECVVGRGAISEVVKVTRKHPFALKFFNSFFIESENDDDDENIVADFAKFQRFQQEYELINRLDHPNIIRAFGIFFGDETHRPCILLEYFSESLASAAKRLNDEERVSIVYEVAKAMRHVHRAGIVHRNLKPENIFVDNDVHAKIGDFCMAALIDVGSDEMSRTQVAGALEFIAPEVVRCEHDYDEKVDVYSFGSVVYFTMSRGERPRITLADAGAGRMPKIPKKIGKEWSDLISRCWASEAKNRPSFESIVEMIGKLA